MNGENTVKDYVYIIDEYLENINEFENLRDFYERNLNKFKPICLDYINDEIDINEISFDESYEILYMLNQYLLDAGLLEKFRNEMIDMGEDWNRYKNLYFNDINLDSEI